MPWGETLVGIALTGKPPGPSITDSIREFVRVELEQAIAHRGCIVVRQGAELAQSHSEGDDVRPRAEIIQDG